MPCWERLPLLLSFPTPPSSLLPSPCLFRPSLLLLPHFLFPPRPFLPRPPPSLLPHPSSSFLPPPSSLLFPPSFLLSLRPGRRLAGGRHPPFFPSSPGSPPPIHPQFLPTPPSPIPPPLLPLPPRSANQIGDGGAGAFAQALNGHTALKTMDLRRVCPAAAPEGLPPPSSLLRSPSSLLPPSSFPLQPPPPPPGTGICTTNERNLIRARGERHRVFKAPKPQQCWYIYKRLTHDDETQSCGQRA